MIVRRSVSASRVPAPRAAGFTGLIAVSACLCPARACLGLLGGIIPPAMLASRSGYAPPECAFQSHSTSPFVLCIMQCCRCGSGSPLRCLFLWAAPSPPVSRALSHPGYPAGHPSRHQGRYSSAGHSPTDWYTLCHPGRWFPAGKAVAYPPRERWPQIGKPAVSGTPQARFSAFPLSQARATNPNSGGRPFFRELEVHHIQLLFQ